MIDTPASEVSAPAGRRWLAVSGLVLLVLLGVCWWGTHPNQFASVGNTIATGKAVVGAPLLYGVFVDPRGSVVLRDVRARVRENTADARVRVVVCETREVIGSALGAAESACSVVLPVGGTTLWHLDASQGPDVRQVLVEVTPRKPGRVFIDGVDVSYRSGLRWGWEATGTEIDVTAPAAG